MSEEKRPDPEVERTGDPQAHGSGGGLTGASGTLTPDELGPEPFVAAERREVSDPVRAGRVTEEQRRYAAGRDAVAPKDDGTGPAVEGPTVMAQEVGGYGSRHGLSRDDPAYRVDEEPDATPRASQPDAGDTDTYSDTEQHL
jgi:hypothetical protein